MYLIRFARDLQKQFARFPKHDQIRIAEVVRDLSENPRPAGSKHLRDALYRIRVGNYRVVYAVFDKALVVIVVKAARRNERTYKDLGSLIKKAQSLLDFE